MDEQLQEQIAELKKMTDKSTNIVFFGGAGVSTESGIPDFRSEDGLYHQKYKYPPETIVSHSFYRANPKEFYRFYRNKMLMPDAQPNAAHKKLAEWEQQGKLNAVITQNIDDLHERAGSKDVVHLHGEITKLRSENNETATVPLEGWEQHYGDRHPDGSLLRPYIVFFGEGVPYFDEACRIASQADIMVVVGTSQMSILPLLSSITHRLTARSISSIRVNRSSACGRTASRIFAKKPPQPLWQTHPKPGQPPGLRSGPRGRAGAAGPLRP